MTNHEESINVQERMENTFKETCGTWQNCNQSTVLSFFSQCNEHGIDPQFCFNWLEQNKEQLTNWPDFSQTAQEWVTEHTSSGSPISLQNQED